MYLSTPFFGTFLVFLSTRFHLFYSLISVVSAFGPPMPRSPPKPGLHKHRSTMITSIQIHPSSPHPFPIPPNPPSQQQNSIMISTIKNILLSSPKPQPLPHPPNPPNPIQVHLSFSDFTMPLYSMPARLVRMLSIGPIRRIG